MFIQIQKILLNITDLFMKKIIEKKKLLIRLDMNNRS